MARGPRSALAAATAIAVALAVGGCAGSDDDFRTEWEAVAPRVDSYVDDVSGTLRGARAAGPVETVQRLEALEPRGRRIARRLDRLEPTPEAEESMEAIAVSLDRIARRLGRAAQAARAGDARGIASAGRRLEVDAIRYLDARRTLDRLLGLEA